jgi:hypothetical protein
MTTPKLFKLLLFVSLLSKATVGIAQETIEKKAHFGISVSPAFAIGNFASKDYDNPSSGWANPGFSFSMTLDYKLGKGNWGISALSRSQVHLFDAQAYANELAAKMSGAYWIVESSGWGLNSLLVGGFGSVPISSKVSFNGKALLGYTTVTQPDITSIGYVGGNSFWVKQSTSAAISFSYMLSTGFKFELGKKYLLLTGIDYLGAAPEFSNVEILSSDGDRTFDTWRQNISTINLNLGVAIKL